MDFSLLMVKIFFFKKAVGVKRPLYAFTVDGHVKFDNTRWKESWRDFHFKKACETKSYFSLVFHLDHPC